MRLLQELDELSAMKSVMAGIGSECTEFLSNSFELYRGIDANITIQKIPIRQDRQPLDTDHISSGLFNYLFEKEHNIKDIRMRSMFCTSDRRQATRYGALHWVFPVNGCEAWASPGVRDSRAIVDRVLLEQGRLISTEQYQKAMQQSTSPVFSGEFFKFIEEHGSRDAQIALDKIVANTRATFAKYQRLDASRMKTLPADTEIMVVGPAYYAANVAWVSETYNIPYEDVAFNQLVSSIKKTVP